MLRTLLVFGILSFGLAAAIRSRFAALLLYLWFAFFRPEEWIWVDVSALRLSLMLGIVLVIPSLLSGKLPNLSHPLSTGATVFFGCALLAQFDAVNQDVGLYWLEYLGKLLLIVMLTVKLVDTRERFLLTLAVVAGSFGFHAAKAGLASLLAGGLHFMEGPGGSFIDNNAYAIGMAMIVPLLVCVVQNAKWRPMLWGAAAAAPLVAVAVVGTYSRAGFLSLVAGALTLICFQRRRATWLLLALLVAAPLGYFVKTQAGYLERMQTIQTYEQVEDRSALGRFHFWEVALGIAADRPLGIGLFNFESAYDRYDFLDGEFGTRRSVHSSHLQVLTEVGWLGAATWTAMFGYAFLVAFRVRRRARNADINEDDRNTYLTAANAVIASMAAFLVGGSFISMALNDLTWITFGLLAALDRVSASACHAAAAAPEAAAAPQFNLELAPARSLGAARQAVGQ
jgi:putative inorganic carbon (hco3(-)) transporter